MHNIAQIQEEMQNAILGREANLDFIEQSAGISTKERMQVHLDTVFSNLTNNLKIIYPGIWQLIGEECASGVALAYSHDMKHLVGRERINNFGEHFPEFLRQFPSIKHLKYLPDYAQLEQLRYKSYSAKRGKVVSLKELQQVFQSDEVESYKLTLNDSVLFLKSIYPLMSIQELLENKDSKPLDLTETKCFLIICKTQKKLETLSAREAEWNFLRSLANSDAVGNSVESRVGNTIGKAMESLPPENIEPELTKIIQLMLSKQMISKIYV